jgi:pyruvate dehydrogenase E2 component (dihydrolipoamide acetyltransferase)
LFRKKIGKKNETHISINSVIVKATANALKDFPIISGMWLSIDKIWIPEHGEITIWGSVQTGDWVGIYIIEDASQKKLIQISDELNVQIDEIKSKNKYIPEGWKPKTPSLYIANLGVIGPLELGLAATFPKDAGLYIVNATLGVCAMLEKPAVKDGQVAVRKMMNVTLNFDERAMMPNTPIKFLIQLKRNLEKPETYLV